MLSEKDLENIVGNILDLADIMMSVGCSENDIARAMDRALEMFEKNLRQIVVSCSNGRSVIIKRSKNGFEVEVR